MRCQELAENSSATRNASYSVNLKQYMNTIFALVYLLMQKVSGSAPLLRSLMQRASGSAADCFPSAHPHLAVILRSVATKDLSSAVSPTNDPVLPPNKPSRQSALLWSCLPWCRKGAQRRTSFRLKFPPRRRHAVPKLSLLRRSGRLSQPPSVRFD